MDRILVGVGDPPRALVVLATALRVARARAGKVVLLRAIGVPPEVRKEFWKADDDALLGWLKRRAERYLNRCAAEVAPELLAGRVVSTGTPWQVLCDAGRQLDAALIVVGDSERRGFDRLLDTIAMKVTRHASCPVMVVRGGAGDGESSAIRSRLREGDPARDPREVGNGIDSDRRKKAGRVKGGG